MNRANPGYSIEMRGFRVRKPDQRENTMNDIPPNQPTPPPITPNDLRARRRLWAGVVLLLIGILFLLREIWGTWWDWGRLWPIVLIVIGVAMLLEGRRR
ncbi:MAG: hypothetical protein GX604_06060 [Actinobacteria bacterium]|nr:hypothetical protein [Actinomycetota bacterium]